MKKIKIIPNEYLLSNYIDKDFQATLFPLRLLPSIFLLSRFNITNNFITPDKKFSLYIKCVLGSIILVMSQFLRFSYYFFNSRIQYFSKNSMVKILLLFDLVYYSGIGIAIHIASGIQSDNVVELIIKVQRVLTSIKADKKRLYFRQKMHNWISLVSLAFVYGVVVVRADTGLEYMSFLLNVLMNFPLSVFDVHILIATCTVVLIKNVLAAWICKMDERKKANTNDEEELKDIEFAKRMFNAYADIVKAFRLCNKVFQIAVTSFAFQTFFQMLHTLQTVIELGKSSPETSFYKSALMWVFSALWNLKNVFLISSLGVACENFYTTVRMAESSCAQILNDEQAEGMRRTCKNVVRLNRATLRKMTAFGVFEFDAAFPLRLLSGLVSYTVVLLQFAFL